MVVCKLSVLKIIFILKFNLMQWIYNMHRCFLLISFFHSEAFHLEHRKNKEHTFVLVTAPWNKMNMFISYLISILHVFFYYCGCSLMNVYYLCHDWKRCQLSEDLNQMSWTIHTHPHAYVYIYVCVCIYYIIYILLGSWDLYCNCSDLIRNAFQ